MRRSGAFDQGTAILLAGTVAALVLAIVLGHGGALARGWLVAFAAWSAFSVGSLVLLMIHSLTGGRWGEALDPVLRPGALLVPSVALAFVPIGIGHAAIYRWAFDPAAIDPGVARWYLNGAGFLLRAAVTLVGWSVLGIIFGRGHGGRLLAALGLAFYGLTIGFASTDWFLSVEPRYTSTAFPAVVAIGQMLTALAVAVVAAPPSLKEKAAGDVGALLIATILGLFYLELMTFIVVWYGDLPEKADWYLKRGSGGWAVTIGAVVALAIAALALLLHAGVRRNRGRLRIAGGVVLAAVVVHAAWLIAPAFPVQGRVLLAAAACFLALCSLTLILGRAFSPPLARPRQDERREPAPLPRPAESAAAPPPLRPIALLGLLIAAVEAWRNHDRARPAAARRIAPTHASPRSAREPSPPEAPGVSPVPVLAVSVGFLAFAGVCVAGFCVYFSLQFTGPLIPRERDFPTPRLQVHPQSDVAKVQAEQGRALAGYGWVDRQREIVRVPIERAIEAILKRGPNAFDPLPSSDGAPYPQNRRGSP